jgi:transposase
MITTQQYRRLMNEHQSTGNMTQSALKAGMSRPTARKYLESGQTPEQLQAKHDWRTRLDPVAEIWPEAEARLKDAPELEAKALFEHLQSQQPGKLSQKHLRTFQRRVKLWRLQYGQDKEVFFPQDWEPGRAMQLDWTHAGELAVTIAGVFYDHLLCHTVLPYSNWQWATRCQSESLLSLRQGLQEGLHRLGKVPQELRVDNSSAATHCIGAAQAQGKREFNPEFVSVCAHYGLAPKTIGIACPNENGDVESGNGHLKRRLKQHLLLRGSRDFASEADYDRFLERVLERANASRADKVAEELAVMKPLPPTRLAEYDELVCSVSSASTIRVKKVTYSVPARLIGSQVKVEVYESELRLYSGRQQLLTLPRQRGDRGVVLNYRHVIDHLLRKPGALERYRYREQLYPTPTFRQAYDRLVAEQGQRRGSLEYLRLLKLASEAGQSDVELMLVEFVCPPYPKWTAEQVRQMLAPRPPQAIVVGDLIPEVAVYDRLLNTSRKEVGHVG